MPKFNEPTDADLEAIENETDPTFYDDLIDGDVLGLVSPMEDPDLDWLFG